MKVATELGPLAVSRLRSPGKHAVGGVNGLYLQVLPTGGRTWILRVVIGSARREMGLGGYPDVPLARARERAREARELIRNGVDPIEHVRAAKRKLQKESARMTFNEAAAAYIAAHEPSWKNPKHRAQWHSTLTHYAGPVFGGVPVDRIDLRHILDTLEPIWATKTVTATRLRGRIETVLDWCAAREMRSSANPARWRGHLDKILPAPAKLSKTVHRRALPIDQMPDFMARLRKVGGVGAKALEFTILTAARSGETRLATWSEFDLDKMLWIVPGSRMKAGREHRVPLSMDAVRLLEVQLGDSADGFVFCSPDGAPLSDMALTSVLRRMKAAAVPHGFRSTFRDWAAERTAHASDVAEMALAHAVGNKVEAAYRRGDLFEKRRALMNDWATFCNGSARRMPV